MSSLYNSIIEAWFLKSTEVSLTSTAGLSGQKSLYDRFGGYCQLRGLAPGGIMALDEATYTWNILPQVEVEMLVRQKPQYRAHKSPKQKCGRSAAGRRIKTVPLC